MGVFYTAHLLLLDGQSHCIAIVDEHALYLDHVLFPSQPVGNLQHRLIEAAGQRSSPARLVIVFCKRKKMGQIEMGLEKGKSVGGNFLLISVSF